MLATASELFRRQGYHGTGLNQILSESGAPAGSLYFHFPGGKAELAVEAVGTAGGEIGQGIEFLLQSSDSVAEAVARVIAYLADDLRGSGYERGCPVGTVVLEAASSSEPIRLACEAVFADWGAKIAARMRAAGWTPKAAKREALVVVALIEGALLLSRARRDTAPLEAAGHHVRSTLVQPLGRRRSKRS